MPRQRANVAGMRTLTKAKTKAAKTVRAVKTKPRASAQGFTISAVTGLPFKPLAPGQKPLSKETLKAALDAAL
jgi:hypothetical protein